jgi:tRNA uridine 5-carbamoylmethylation protein Kti12
MFCGLPSAGKSTLAAELAAYISSEGHEVKVISFESLSIDRNKGYESKEQMHYTESPYPSFLPLMHLTINMKQTLLRRR